MSEAKRLDKFITECFEISRSALGKEIRKGAVLVNGQLMKDPAFKVYEGDVIDFYDQHLEVFSKLYFMLNKPTGCVCANDDAHNPIVFSYLSDIYGINSCHCVGRLDLDTTGLLLLTNDGQWSHRISSPKKHLGKTYLVTLRDRVTDAMVASLSKGMLLTGEKKPTSPALVEIKSDYEIELTIYEGKYHQVKRMIWATDNEVVRLHRKSIGPLVLDSNLDFGEYRSLTSEEIALFD